MNHTYLYGGAPAQVTSAAGAKGVIIRSFDGAVTFRVYHDRDRFTDYEIRHDELSVTIGADELAAFYRVCGHDILDHDPQVLGLNRITSR